MVLILFSDNRTETPIDFSSHRAGSVFTAVVNLTSSGNITSF